MGSPEDLPRVEDESVACVLRGLRAAGGYTLGAYGSIQSWKGVVLVETAGEQHVEILGPWAGVG